MGAVRLTDETRATIQDKDAFELAMIEAGVSDILEEDDHTEIRCPVERFAAVLDAVKAFGMEPDDSGLEWFAKESVALSAEDAAKGEHLIDVLEENDDVDSVYINVG
ncbi:MAG: hypothetical protein COU35_05095 [Candidatus Magasanikbacteria bacterium CG10_big_fil_rev_8_21_14_0_10_47_10]|uniref:TACO1/YebC-like second and third domain-containing protein n=1 Tax=Candidatus Magasanikbacteria bacterium CG10_big_fil_rev_8_21_14_0_10_47_10 TaxID=1974652 RepID=A0A2H0TRA2_9BACT|nr:MAG: hypothetical protein COU35_05095 [Candidatus Magasanikbacteria bacterium CG10_big_fil_rev_8_21_14_0_10_47_10]